MKGQSFLKVFGMALCVLGLGFAAIHVRAEEAAPPTVPASAEPAANLQSLYAQADQALEKGEHDKAVALLTQIIKRDPRQAKAYFARAEIYEEQNRPDLAMADYRQVIALDPKNAGAYGNLGWLLIVEGRFEEAHEPTEKAHTLEPDEFTWLINLGDLALLAGDRERARTYYRRGLEQITSNEEFEKGPIADLELFIQKGWAVEAARQELAWLREAFAPRQRWHTFNQQAMQASQAKDYPAAEKAARAALEVAETAFGSDHPDTVQSFDNLAWALHQQGRYADAEPLYRRVLAIREKALPPDHLDTAATLSRLGVALHEQRRYADAEPLLQRALAIWEKALGPDHPNVVASINNLAELYRAQGLFAKAEPLYRRTLTIREKTLPPDHPDLTTTLNLLAVVLYLQGRYTEAEPLYRGTLAIREKVLSPHHPDTARSLDWLVMCLKGQGRYADAEPLAQRALAIREKAHGPDHPDVAESLNNLAVLYKTQGQYAKAEPLAQRALAIYEKAHGPDHPDLAATLNGLAGVLRLQGRYADAEPLAQRALAIREKAHGPDHPDVAESLNNLAALYYDQGQYAKVEPLAQRALAIYEKAHGPDHPDVALSLNGLALLYKTQGQYAKAEPLYRRALAIKALRPDHPGVARSLNNLAVLYHDQGQYGEAEPLLQRALAIYEKAHGPDHPVVATSLNNLAALYRDQGRYADAEPLLRRAVAIAQKTDTPTELLFLNRHLGSLLVQRGQLRDALPHYRAAADALDRLFANTRGLPEEARLTFLGQYAYVYREFLDLLLRLHEQDAKAGFDREFLAVASRNQSRIFSELLRQGDVNRLAGDPAFVQLKEQRQTLLTQLATLREKQTTLPVTAPNAEGQKADLQTRLAELSAELTPLEDRLWRHYPRFMELLAIPRPVTVEQLQAELLRPGEALLGVVLLPERAVVLAVTRERFTFHVAPPTAPEIGQRVKAIRAGLVGDLAHLERLDPADLHALYRDLIAPVEPVLKDAQRVLVVADGPLYSLPLELLITDYDEAQQAAFREARKNATGRPHRPALLSEYAGLPYLADRHAFRYLPSLAALASQRRYPKPAGPVTRDVVAFADPVFSPAETATASPATRSYTPATQQALARLTRSVGLPAGALQRLPETADEARALAAAVPGPTRLYLRQDAQEHTVKALAQAGDLTGVRYLLFATHGLLAGEFRPPEPPPDPAAPLDPGRRPRAAPREPLGQPALVLTLAPARPDEDGFLTLKDVIEDLDLNAELVILSACNTAGDPAKTNTGEGFAGLTRAFLFAGARHLWVSHWPVESAAARDLTTAAVRAREAGQTDPAAALAQARKTLRASVVPFPFRGESRPLARAHPFFWAPFVTVGD